MIKKIIKGTVALMMLLAICGCSSNESKNVSVDDGFYIDLKQGLIDRWKLTDAQDDYDADDFNNYIDAELNCVKKYKKANFENEDIGKYAKDYIQTLYDAKKLTKYIDSDLNKWEAQYTNGIYDDRCVALVHLNNLKKIKFDEKSQTKNFKGLLETGNTTINVRKLIENVNFEKEPDEYEDETYHTYSMVMENITDTDFSYFSFNINLEDDSGVVVETTSAYTDNWGSGQKHRFEFSTDAQFSKIVVPNAEYSY